MDIIDYYNLEKESKVASLRNMSHDGYVGVI